MKITIVQGAFFPVPPLLGGAVEKIWFRLGKEFACMGHEVIHISRRFPGLAEEESVGGVKYLRVHGYSTPKSKLLHKLLDGIYSVRAIRAVPEDADVVITNSFWSPVFLSRNKKAIVYVSVERMPKGQMRYYPRANRLRANSTAVSEAIKAELPASWHHRVGMVPNPLPFEASEQIDLSAKEKTILYCGRVHPEKGIDLLAMTVCDLDLNGWRIQIVGPWEISQGGGGVEYKRKLERSFGKCDVKFLGPVFDEDRLGNIYRKASVFVYPSLAEKGETFGLAPLEAMAWGTVPIVSDLACFKDFIHHGENGLIFDHRTITAKANLAEAIKLFIGDAKARASSAIEALKVSETYSAACIAAQLVTEFESLIAARRDQFD